MSNLEIGKLYRSRNWSRQDLRGEPALYLGEKIFRRSDMSTIVNYEFLIKNKKHLVDRTFLKYMVNYNDDKYGW
jgi:hypothetical protein